MRLGFLTLRETREPRIPLTIVRMLVLPNGSGRDVFISGPREIPDLPYRLFGRLQAGGNLFEKIRRALAVDFKEYRYALEQIDAFYAFYGDQPKSEAHAALAEIKPEWFGQMQAQCRDIYCQVLFPNAQSEEDMSTDKFDMLRNHLSEGDLLLLHSWLLHGSVLDSRRSYDLSSDSAGEARNAVERIRRACVSALGIPLIQYREEPPGIVLDLIPALQT